MVITQFISDIIHAHIQGEQVRGGNKRERGRGTGYTAPAQGPKGGVFGHTHWK